jgi:hypothetical protein
MIFGKARLPCLLKANLGSCAVQRARYPVVEWRAPSLRQQFRHGCP